MSNEQVSGNGSEAPELPVPTPEDVQPGGDEVDTEHDEARLAKIMRIAIQKATGLWNGSLEVSHEQE